MKHDELFKYNYNGYLRQMMLCEGFNIREMAKKTGLSYETVRQTLNNRGSVNSVIKLCKPLGISFKKLLEDVKV